jgi:hypothetical protein
MNDELVKPAAYLVPYLLSFKGAISTSCPPPLRSELEGTVMWGASLLGDAHPVIDKLGETHCVKPLYDLSSIKAKSPLTDAELADPEYMRAYVEGLMETLNEIGELVVTRHPDGRILAVTRQDADGRILKVIAEATNEPD